MTQKEVFQLTIGILEEHEFQYMVCDSVAAILYGQHRLTDDMDIVIAVLPQRACEFFRAFDATGFYCPPVEVLENELRQRGQFNLLHQDTGVKIDCIVLKEDRFSREEFRGRQRRPFSATQEANLARPEDVILAKLQYYKMGQSEKHLRDIRGMLRVSGDKFDFTYLTDWVNELELHEQWDLVKPQ